MQTTRIGGIVTTSPNTQWWMGADWIGQNWAGNYSILRTSLTCANGPSGSTGSFTNAAGEQYSWWGGGRLQTHGFANLPSGYAQNQIRWDDTADHTFGHDGNGFLGDIAFGMHVHYGTTSGEWYGSIPAPARIPKPPSAPTFVAGTPDQITPNSMRVQFNAGADNGAGQDAYEIHWSTSPSGGMWSTSSGGTTVFTGLSPATTYYFWARGHNAAGWGAFAGPVSATTLSGAYISDGNTWRPAGVYESDGTNWLNRVVQVSNGTTWQNAL